MGANKTIGTSFPLANITIVMYEYAPGAITVNCPE
jgi:hypothetical protein